jgi:hypothetical protein
MYNHLYKVGDQCFLPTAPNSPLNEKADGTFWYNDVNYGTPLLYNEEGQARMNAAYDAGETLPDPQSLISSIAV